MLRRPYHKHPAHTVPDSLPISNQLPRTNSWDLKYDFPPNSLALD
jgi:hypothetical protein